jgi:hypothetical protein
MPSTTRHRATSVEAGVRTRRVGEEKCFGAAMVNGQA